MITVNQSDPDFRQQRHSLLAAVGTPGSGADRYAAAMYFFQLHMMSARMLEIYRRCSKFDHEDPLDLARREGVEIPALPLERQPGT